MWVVVEALLEGMVVQSPQALVPSFCRYSQRVMVLSEGSVQDRSTDVSVVVFTAAVNPVGLRGRTTGEAVTAALRPFPVEFTARSRIV